MSLQVYTLWIGTRLCLIANVRLRFANRTYGDLLHRSRSSSGLRKRAVWDS